MVQRGAMFEQTASTLRLLLSSAVWKIGQEVSGSPGVRFIIDTQLCAH